MTKRSTWALPYAIFLVLFVALPLILIMFYAFRDASGNNLNIASADTLPQDITAIAINVDNFQEAYDFFIAHGFVNPRGDAVTDTSSSRATMLFSPSGYAVNIAEHIK
jgi:ABC-type sugar transport system permease subunit